MSTFGTNLRKIRISKNMTQDALAVFLGTSKQVISRYENGLRSPKVSVVAEFAERLGVSIAELAEPLPESDVDNSVAPAEADPVESELIAIYRGLNSIGQTALLGTARGLFSNPDMKRGGKSTTETA